MKATTSRPKTNRIKSRNPTSLLEPRGRANGRPADLVAEPRNHHCVAEPLPPAVGRSEERVDGNHKPNAGPPPSAQLVQMAMSYQVSQMLYVAAHLRLADHLAQEPRRAEELAELTGTHAPSLYRFLRTLSGLGLFAEDSSQRFGLTPLGAALQDGAPGAARPSVLTLASDWFRGAFGHLLYSLQTGRTGFEKHLGMPVFDWLAGNPEAASLFSQTMVGVHGAEPAAVAAAYDFSGLETIVDVGGATGNLLSTILTEHLGPRGVLYDLPHVLRDAPALIESRGLTDRVRLEPGSFFEAVPAGGDAYVLSHIIHDWSEEQCLTILGNCRRQMKRGTRLLLVEMVLPPGNEPHPGKMLDMVMLVGPGGRERSEQEYRRLFAQADLRLARVVPTESPVSVMEAVVA